MPVTTATCSECGFDAADYTHDDLLGTLRAQSHIWRAMTEGLDASTLAARPAPGSPSALEHAVAAYEAARTAADVLDRVNADDSALDADARLDLSAVVGAIEANAMRVNAIAGATKAPDWTTPIIDGRTTTDVAGLVARAAHDASHHTRAAGRGLHRLGAGAPHQRGTLVQVSSSKGGVPKTPLLSAVIDRRGIVGDRQAERRHHGRPLQALCLWSEEVIDALRSEGHTMHAGAAGENLTVAGIEWTTIRPGVVLAVGAVRLEISAFATPCAKNAQWFRDGKFRRMDHNEHPGWSRAYAWVLEGGTVAAGDAVIVEP